MKKLLATAVLGLGLSGFALADDIGDFSNVKPTMGQPFDGQTLGRGAAPVPMPTSAIKGAASHVNDRAGPNA